MPFGIMPANPGWYRPLSLSLCGVLLGACGDEPYPIAQFEVPRPVPAVAPETPCDDRNPWRNAYWGDLHVHTAISTDAWQEDVRMMPDDALRFGFGGPVSLPPMDDQGNPTRTVSIDRPLDFVAVTDHAEFLGEAWLCTSETSGRYDSDFCQNYRDLEPIDLSFLKYIASPWGFRDDDACGEDGQRCRDAATNYWQQNIAAAEKWDDKSSACERTAFIAYEYSSFRMGSNLHRNVIFRNNVVPRLPISHIEEPLEWNLWQRLKELCKDSGTGCDVLAIPHNSNISNGRMFNVDYYGARTTEQEAARAALRLEMEPVVEIMQHKGDSECRDGIVGILDSEDELCAYEKMEDRIIQLDKGKDPLVDDCPTGILGHWMPHIGPDCYSPLSYARYALIEGLAEEERLGVNPFKFGLSASTDTHNALAGGVEERSFPGHLGMGYHDATERTSYVSTERGGSSNNPGGIIGIWAEENNRGALFDAMRRREVFGTSGPRITPRFFGGWDYPESFCERAGTDGDWLQSAYQQGVAMGGDLPGASPRATAPSLVAMAVADPGTAKYPGTPLQRLQIIKGWVDDAGNRRTRVYDVAGDPDNGATVDTATCRQSGAGFHQLCSVWRDPDFDPSQRSVYYLRAVENPSCRFDAWQCIHLEGDERPPNCDVDTREQPKSQQERAWSSPIWYTPE